VCSQVGFEGGGNEQRQRIYQLWEAVTNAKLGKGAKLVNQRGERYFLIPGEQIHGRLAGRLLLLPVRHPIDVWWDADANGIEIARSLPEAGFIVEKRQKGS